MNVSILSNHTNSLCHIFFSLFFNLVSRDYFTQFSQQALILSRSLMVNFCKEYHLLMIEELLIDMFLSSLGCDL